MSARSCINMLCGIWIYLLESLFALPFFVYFKRYLHYFYILVFNSGSSLQFARIRAGGSWWYYATFSVLDSLWYIKHERLQTALVMLWIINILRRWKDVTPYFINCHQKSCCTKRNVFLSSVLQRHHFAQTMCIINSNGCNIFENLNNAVRTCIYYLVLCRWIVFMFRDFIWGLENRYFVLIRVQSVTICIRTI